MLHIKFHGNWPSVPEKKIFDRFYQGCGGRLGHVTSMSSDFHFLVPESFQTKFRSAQ